MFLRRCYEAVNPGFHSSPVLRMRSSVRCNLIAPALIFAHLFAESTRIYALFNSKDSLYNSRVLDGTVKTRFHAARFPRFCLDLFEIWIIQWYSPDRSSASITPLQIEQTMSYARSYQFNLEARYILRSSRNIHMTVRNIPLFILEFKLRSSDHLVLIYGFN